jgi:adenosylcobinamide-GDP ribazoletransferase
VAAVREALALLTTLGGAAPLTSRALRWFPFVGALAGVIVGASWWGAAQWWPPAVAAALVVALDLALTGMLHVDGAADAADGLLPHLSRERRLAVMRTPDIGAFGVGAVGAALLLQFAALASSTPEPLVVVGLWCASRSLVAAVPAFVQYARADGMASPLLTDTPRWPALFVAPATVIAGFGAGRAGLAAVVGGVAAGIAVVALARRRIGGFTGDVLGAVIVVTQTIGLVVMAAKW